MIKKIVTNTSPLLAFAKMQAFDVMGSLPFEFVCPEQVKAEILIGAQQGYDVEIPEFLKVLSLSSPISPIAVAALDTGEAAVIQLALEQNIEIVCIDERAGAPCGDGSRAASDRLARTARQSQNSWLDCSCQTLYRNRRSGRNLL